jgi:hypothetical protein
MRHERRQIVVVAEPDLVHGDRVVFIDDRNHPEFEQGRQRVPGVHEPFPVRQILMRQ